MNKINPDKQVRTYVITVIMAVAFCLYAIVVSIKDLNSNVPTKEQVISKHVPLNISTLVLDSISDNIKNANDIIQVDKKTTLPTESPKQSLMTDDLPSEDESTEEVVNGVSVNTTTRDVKKTVVVLDAENEQLAEVCFRASDESVFMSYGWKGLAQKAVDHRGTKKTIDEVKIELKDNCTTSLMAKWPIITLSTNPNAVQVKTVVF